MATAIAIIESAANFARSIGSGAKVTTGQGTLTFSIDGSAGRAEMIETKNAVIGFLLENHGDRNFKHIKHGTRHVWRWYIGRDPEGLRCGIAVRLNDAERTAKASGPSFWRALQG